ncbi:MAG: hypothetical protein ABSH19_07975 [Opitutales bacterium]|jgi:hypothetical protein
MSAFDVEAYGPVIAGLLRGVPPAPLDAGAPNAKFRAALAGLTAENLLEPAGRTVRDERMAQGCLAGLWLRHNFMEESHGISQELETPTGSFWHGILHRREPDFGNARYWFRRVGRHPVFPALNEAAMAEGWPVGARWDAVALVDAVERVSRTGAEAEAKLCRAVQQREWELLFDYCWKQAGGA